MRKLGISLVVTAALVAPAAADAMQTGLYRGDDGGAYFISDGPGSQQTLTFMQTAAPARCTPGPIAVSPSMHASCTGTVGPLLLVYDRFLISTPSDSALSGTTQATLCSLSCELSTESWVATAVGRPAAAAQAHHAVAPVRGSLAEVAVSCVTAGVDGCRSNVRASSRATRAARSTAVTIRSGETRRVRVRLRSSLVRRLRRDGSANARIVLRTTHPQAGHRVTSERPVLLVLEPEYELVPVAR